ncbi:hypothetical protein ACS0TY_032636 [Phlomoides rotata]
MTSYSVSLILILISTSTVAKTLHHHTHTPKNATAYKLHQAYTALQAWKRVIYSDPRNFTSNWIGPNVCAYNGVYCAAHPNESTNTMTVAGIDLNHGDIAGFLPPEFGLLSDLALLHLNSNRFCGIIPETFSALSLLFELELSNNRFVGPFPSPLLSLPSLRFLDIRYNEFEGHLPPKLFSMNLDAIFVNSNRFTSVIPQTLGSSSASVVVFANNRFGGCLPPTIANFADTLEELLLINTSISGCLPIEEGICGNLTSKGIAYDDRRNCLPEKELQRSVKRRSLLIALSMIAVLLKFLPLLQLYHLDFLIIRKVKYPVDQSKSGTWTN